MFLQGEHGLGVLSWGATKGPLKLLQLLLYVSARENVLNSDFNDEVDFFFFFFNY